MKPHDLTEVVIPNDDISISAFNVASVALNKVHDAALDLKECPGCVLEAMQLLLNNMPEQVWNSLHGGERKPGQRVLMIMSEEVEDEIGDTAGCA